MKGVLPQSARIEGLTARHQRNLAERRLHRLFRAVYRWARWKCSRVPRLTLFVGCGMIERDRVRGNPRSFMHCGHITGRICVTAKAAKLSDQQVLGAYFHEIGHLLAWDLIGRSQQWDADRACLFLLGVRIKYGSGLVIERVSPSVVRRVLRR